jgi:imidazolonepropionase-like amidohydrolase
MAEVLHLTGPILLSADEVRSQAWVLGGRVTYEEPTGARDIRTIQGWVLPGLVDAHSHIGLGTQGAVDEATSEAQALADREAGALLLRDCGSPADTRWVQARADLPRVVRAGRHIARTRRYLRNYAHEVEPEDLVAQVEVEAGRGDGWVKLVGDWIDRDRGDLAPSWPREAFAAAIARAHELGARVTAHCFGEEVLYDLAEAGIDCVEHATGLEPETINRFAAQGIAIVPTLVNIETFPAIASAAREKFPTYHDHMLDLHARRFETIAAAYAAGVRIYLGTDAGGTIPHGLVALEAANLVRVGMSTLDVLDATCWAARTWLGYDGLTEGAEADLVVYPEDPRTHVGVLAHPDVVILRGVVVRS